MTLYVHFLALFLFVRLLSQLIRVKFLSSTAFYILEEISNKHLDSSLSAFINKKAKGYAVNIQNRNTGSIFGLITKIGPIFQLHLPFSGKKALSMSVTAMDEAVTTRAA